MFPHLASPVAFGPMRLRNRVVLLPHGLTWARRDERLPTERSREYYAGQARGGVGLVCMESAIVSLSGEQRVPLVLCSDPRAVDGYARIGEAVHAEGAVISGQLNHYGFEAEQRLTRRPLLAPSRIPSTVRREQAKPMSRDDLDEVRDAFVQGARNYAAAGLDAVEIKAGLDGLMRQFLSPLHNERDDEYGGSAENRVRYLIEVGGAIRDAIGPDLALGVRLGVDEYAPGGYEVADAIAFARALEASGHFDWISAAFGGHAAVDRAVSPMAIEEGFGVSRIARLAAATTLPIVAIGRIHRPAHAEQILADGHASAIGMARELIAEPDWANKALGGTPEQIRPCTACNQLCIGNLFDILPIGCVVNPHMGFGHRRVRVAAPPSSVVVVGGGPAGLEAARVAAEDGHAVTLLERSGALGGQLAIAARASKRDGWTPYLDWLARELERLGVDVRLDVNADRDGVLALAPDLVVVAAGSVPGETGLSPVLTLDEFLAGEASAPRVAAVDCGLSGIGLWSAAIEAGVRGASELTVVTAQPLVGGDIDWPTAVTVRGALFARRARLVPDSAATSLQDGRLVATNLYSGEQIEVEVDLVIASPQRVVAGGELAASLDAAGGPRVITVGDAVAPRDAAAACREGQDAMRALLDRESTVASTAA